MPTYNGCLQALVVVFLTTAAAAGCGSGESVTRSAGGETASPGVAAPSTTDSQDAVLEAVGAAVPVQDAEAVSLVMGRMPEQLGGVERELTASSARYGDGGLEVLRVEDGLPPAQTLQERVDMSLTGQGVTVTRRCKPASGVTCARGLLPAGSHVVVWVPEGSQFVFAALAGSADELAALTRGFAAATR